MSFVVDVAINPANTKQRYILFSNGVIEARGGALPVVQHEFSFNEAYTNLAPTSYSNANEGFRALQIISWATPSGYSLDKYGFVYPWGGAVAVPGATAPMTTGPEYLFGTGGGASLPDWGFVADFYMDPGNSGKGYLLLFNGDVIAIGTGVTAVTHGVIFNVNDAAARKLVMDWTSKRYWIGDNLGRIYGRNGGNDRPVGSAASWGGVLAAGATVWGRECRDFVLYDLSANCLGWMVDAFGRVYPIGAAAEPYGFEFTPQYSGWRGLGIVSSASPLRLVQVTQEAREREWITSTAPTATVLFPAEGSTNTTNTRPWVEWNYIDAENDAQTIVEIAVFTAAQYGVGGFNAATSPATWRTSYTGDANLRRARVPTDLVNATVYRAYVRVTDASGLTGAWDYNQWTQNIAPPSTPTVTPTVGSGLTGISLLLHVSTAGLSGSARLGVQYHDSDWDGVTWEFVRGGYDLVPNGSGDATVVDREARFGILRSYRAITYIYDATTDAWSSSAWSATATGTLGPRNVWTLTNPSNSSQDMIVSVREFKPSRPIVTGVFQPVNRKYPVVISDGAPKAANFSLKVWAKSNAVRVGLEALIESDAVLLLRDLFGRAYYLKATGDLEEDLQRAFPAQGEVTALRDFNEISVDMQEVERPSAAPLTGPLVSI